MAKSSLKINDSKWRQVKARFPEIAGVSVDVGIQSDAGTGEKGVPIVAYGAANEFGRGNVPERSFIRSTFDEQRSAWGKLADKLIGGILDLKLAPNKVFSVLGAKAEDDIKQKITALRTPPNSPITIERKGSSNPLFDNGDLRRAIRYVVKK
ncbi:MAG: hypothetical protein IBX56_02305 [Methylomicrobium sp.]|nr:hypothetical protein [Methylomicrobium sp.]